MGLGGLVLGSLILYIKGMRILMFQLSGFYCRCTSYIIVGPTESHDFRTYRHTCPML